MAKKGRHRRYIEAREFQRSSTFSVENFDLDAPDPFALPDTGVRFDDDVDEVEELDDDKYAELAAKYADFGTANSKTGSTTNSAERDDDDEGDPSEVD